MALLLDQTQKVRDKAELHLADTPLLQFRASIHGTGEEVNGAAEQGDGVLISLRHRTDRVRSYQFAVTARAFKDGLLVISFRRIERDGRSSVRHREEITPHELRSDP